MRGRRGWINARCVQGRFEGASCRQDDLRRFHYRTQTTTTIQPQLAAENGEVADWTSETKFNHAMSRGEENFARVLRYYSNIPHRPARPAV
jgi:hypothetical protein